MRLAGQAVNGLQETGHVGCASDRNQGHSPGVLVQLPVEIFLVQAPFRCGPYVDHLSTGPPGQVVGMVFQLGGDHH